MRQTRGRWELGRVLVFRCELRKSSKIRADNASGFQYFRPPDCYVAEYHAGRKLMERNWSCLKEMFPCRDFGVKQSHNFTIPHSTQNHQFAAFTDERQFPKLHSRTVWCHFRRPRLECGTTNDFPNSYVLCARRV